MRHWFTVSIALWVLVLAFSPVMFAQTSSPSAIPAIEAACLMLNSVAVGIPSHLAGVCRQIQ